MVNKKDAKPVSDDKRFMLSAEVGRFFSPEGRLDENLYRQSLNEKFQKLRGNEPDLPTFVKNASEETSDYINSLLTYLGEKGITDEALNLFRVTIEESKIYGIENISISTSYLQTILGNLSIRKQESPSKKPPTDDKRNKILKAAINIFSETGFHKSKIDAIAAEAGIGKGSVYRYFKSKEDILDELLMSAFQDIAGMIGGVTSKNLDIIAMVKEMIEAWLSFISGNNKLYRIIQSESIYSQSGDCVMFYDYLISRLPLFKERVISQNKVSELKTTDFYTVFYGIMGFIDGVVQKWYRQGMDYPLMDEVPVILEVIFNGFVGEKMSQQSFIDKS